MGVLCLAIGAIFGGNGCNQQELERQFVYTMEDGSHGIILIEYKPNSYIAGEKKLGSYYYIVKYFPSEEAMVKGSDLVMADLQEGKIRRKTERSGLLDYEIIDESNDIWLNKKLNDGAVEIAFYDKNGHSLIGKVNRYLFSDEYITTFVPAISSYHTYEANQIKSGLEWKGTLDETWLTFENFCAIDSVKIEYIR